MQLLSHLSTIGKPARIGVSKQCCGKCGQYLKGQNVQFTGEPGEAFENWLEPCEIETTEVKAYNVNIANPAMALTFRTP